MKTKVIFLTTLVICGCSNVNIEPVDYVNPLIGTQSKHSLSAGNTYPIIARPWGMNFWTPQTGKMGDGWQYTYTADKIRGFKQTHQPSPWINDYGQFAIMPITGKMRFNEDERSSWFSHKSEIAKPYYYNVYLADHDVVVEIAPTERAAMMRVTFPDNENSYVVVDAFDKGSEVKIIGSNKIIGYTTKNSGGVPDNFKNYFVIEFDKQFQKVATVVDGSIKEDIRSALCNHAGAIVGFKTKRGEQIHLRIASSFISAEQAEQNLKELDDIEEIYVNDKKNNTAFDALVQKNRAIWNKTLDVISIEDENIDNLRTFYSCLYRCVLFPRMFYEINKEGKMIHYSPYNGNVEDGYMFTDAGFWDVFRALCPLVNLLYPKMSSAMQEGLANAYKESGFLPEWASPGHRNCMVGNNSASVVADAYISGVNKYMSYDSETLWQAVVHGANAMHPNVKSTGRRGYDYYNKLGYVPYDVNINESVARTLEYAYDDWCIYKFGKALNKSDEEISVYAECAFNYRKVFDKETNLMRGRLQDGTFAAEFNPLKWGDAFTEGNSWHYTWSVFHDPAGLIYLMGGKEMFVKMMDSVYNVPPHFDESYYGSVIHEIREMQIMNMGNYAHGNQPIQHFIYLYNYAGEPWKAQYRVREAMKRLYTPTPDGYCGDEDNGQTSAWYVLSALGFYSVCPASGEYVLGSPLFRKATIALENGKKITISAPNNSADNVYVKSMKMNGAGYDKNFLKISDLLQGANIEYEMSAAPNRLRGTNEASFPYSFSKEYKIGTKCVDDERE